MSNQLLKKIVHLRWYKGQQILKSESGQIVNENESMKITHGNIEWKNLLKNARLMGFAKIEVEKLLQPKEKQVEEMNTKGETVKRMVVEYDVVDDVKEISAVQSELDIALNGPAVQLTPEQARIAALEATIERLSAIVGGTSKDPINEVQVMIEKVTTGNTDALNDIEAARAEYLAVTETKAHHKWPLEKIIAETEKAKAEK